MKTMLEPQSNIKISGNFRNLLSQLCDVIGVSFTCDSNANRDCVLSLGDWLQEMTKTKLSACELKHQNKGFVLLFQGQKKLSVEKLQSAVKFMNHTELQIKFTEEKKI